MSDDPKAERSFVDEIDKAAHTAVNNFDDFLHGRGVYGSNAPSQKEDATEDDK